MTTGQSTSSSLGLLVLLVLFVWMAWRRWLLSHSLLVAASHGALSDDEHDWCDWKCCGVKVKSETKQDHQHHHWYDDCDEWWNSWRIHRVVAKHDWEIGARMVAAIVPDFQFQDEEERFQRSNNNNIPVVRLGLVPEPNWSRGPHIQEGHGRHCEPRNAQGTTPPVQ